MLGAFVSGMFEGAKSTFDLMETRNKLEIQNRRMQEGRDAEKLLKDQADVRANFTVSGDTPGFAPAEPTPTTGTSTLPAPPVTPTPIVQGSNPGDPELWEQIKPYIQKYEGTNSYKTGYGLGEKGDITKYPAKPGFFGFPDWPGGTDPKSGRPTHAGGMYQFQPDTWKYYAAREGVNDFSPESQDRVARRAYLEDGLKHWVPFNETLRQELAKAGLLGGLATRAARTGQAAPTTVVSREADADIGGGVTAPPPDLEAQRAAAKPAPVSALSPAAEAVKSVVSSSALSPSAASAAVPVMPGEMAQPYTPAAQPQPLPPALNPVSRSAAPTAAAVETAAAQSALTPPAASPVSPTPVVTLPPPRPMTQRQQYDAAIAAGQRPAFPPGQRFNSRGEAISSDLAPTTPAVRRGFAAANKVTRLPDGSLVDALGNVVQEPPQSALFPR